MSIGEYWASLHWWQIAAGIVLGAYIADDHTFLGDDAEYGRWLITVALIFVLMWR